MTEPTLVPAGKPAALEADDPRVAALERRIADMEASHRDRMIRADLKAEALRAGMIDLDGLRLVDVTAVELGEDGQVKGGEALMKSMRRLKPWLFGLASTSSTAAAPPALPPEQKSAMQMSVDEWRAARADILRRR